MQVGGAIGLAVLATLAAGRTEDLAGIGRERCDALNGGFHLAYLVGVVLVVSAIALAAWVTRPEHRPARATAHGRQETACEPA